MPTGYAWIEHSKFCLSLWPHAADRPHNVYETPEQLLDEVSKRGLTLQWDDPAAVDAWIKSRTESKVTTPAPQSNGTSTAEVIPPAAPAPAKPPMSSGMNITPTTSIANNMVMAVQNLRTVSGRMSSTTAAINATVTKLNSKVDNLDAMRAALEELASKMDV